MNKKTELVYAINALFAATDKKDLPVEDIPKRIGRLKHCNLSTIPKKGRTKPSPSKKGLFKMERTRYNLRGAGRHEIALPL